MLIKILDMDTRKGLFLVGAVNSAETLKVTGYQLAYSLTSTNECVNADLHATGLLIKMENGEVIKYNVRPIDAKLKMAIRKYLASKNPAPVSTPVQPQNNVVNKPPVAKENVQNTAQAVQTKAAPKRPLARAVSDAASSPIESVKAKNNITGGVIRKQITPGDGTKEERIKIYYMGTIYNSPKEICKKFGCEDIDNFTRLYKLGYPMLMCLGKEPFNPNLKVVPREKQHDAYLRSISN